MPKIIEKPVTNKMTNLMFDNKLHKKILKKSKKISTYGLLSVALAGCNNESQYSLSDINNARKEALTDSNGITYITLDEAKSEAAKVALTDNTGKIHDSVDKARQDSLTDSSGNIYNSIDNAISTSVNSALTDQDGYFHSTVDAAIRFNDSDAVSAAVSSLTNFNTLDELVTAYDSLVNPSYLVLTLSNDSPVLTSNNDTIDAKERNSLQSNDSVIDNSSLDKDIMNSNVTVNNISPTIRNIEELNINGDFMVTGLALTNITGVKDLNLTTSITGGTATVTDVAANSVNTINASTNIETLEITALANGTGSSGVVIKSGNAKKININAGAGDDVFNITVGSGSELKLGPVGNFGSKDIVNITLGGDTSITTAKAMGVLNVMSTHTSKITANTSLGEVTDFIGEGDITLSTSGAVADAATSIQSTGSGLLTLELTNISDNDVSTVGADVINHAHNSGTGLTISGSSTLNLAAKAGVSTMNLKNSGTMVMTISEDQTSQISTGANVIALTISATPDKPSDTKNGSIISMSDLALNANTKNVAIIGSEDLMISDLSTNSDTTLSADSMTGNLSINEMGAHNTTMYLGSGTNNIISGNVAASFTITGNNGSDTIDLKGSKVLASSVYSGNGDDNVIGGSGNDTIDTGFGNDVINGGPGNDTISTGHGTDTITMVANEDGDHILDFTKGVDTLILTGNALGDLNISSQTVNSGSYNFDGAGTFDIVLTGFTSTDLSDSVQIGNKSTSNALPGEASTKTTYNALNSGKYNITSGNKNDVISIAVDVGKTIKTGTGNDVIIGTSATAGDIVISDYDMSSDIIILTGATGDKDVVDLSNITVANGKYSFSTNHIINLSNLGNPLTATDLSNSVQLGNYNAFLTLNDTSGATSVQGGKFNDFIELGDNGNADTVFFIDNGGVDTIISFIQGEDKLNFDKIAGISANGVTFAATDNKVNNAVDGEVYVFADEDLTTINTSFDFNGTNNDASLGSEEVLKSAAQYLEAAITEANGEKYIALINTANSDTNIYVAYLVTADSDGIDSSDLTLLGSIDSNAVLQSVDIS